MSRLRITLLCLSFWFAVACASPAPGVTEVSAVSPAAIAQGSDANIMITGSFWAQASVDFGSGSSADVNDTFTATLGNVTLRNVTYVNAQTLEATLSGNVPLGVYDLTVTGPGGVKAVMAQAVSIVPPPCTGPSCRAYVASMTVTPTSGTVADTFTMVGSVTDPNGAPAGNFYYVWDWTSDGRFDAFGQRATHRYTSPGIYTITLVVANTQGDRAETQMTIDVTP